MQYCIHLSLPQAIHSVSWHHEGRQFMCSHSDGSLTMWNLRNTAKPFQVTFPHGEVPLSLTKHYLLILYSQLCLSASTHLWEQSQCVSHISKLNTVHIFQILIPCQAERFLPKYSAHFSYGFYNKPWFNTAHSNTLTTFSIDILNTLKAH